MSYRNLLNQLVTVRRSIETISDTREVTATWVDLATNVKCAFNSRAADSRYEDYGVSVEFDYIIFLDPSQDIKPDGEKGPRDQIVDSDGLTYEVVRVLDPTGRDDVKTALLRRIN